MNEQQLGRLLRMLRMRKEWRLRDVARRAKLSTASIDRTERGWIVSVRVLRQHAAALDLRLDYRVIGRGADVARTLDEEHAAVAEAVAQAFRTAGFLVFPEVSFSEWGERGRIDLVAFDVKTGTLVLVEIKTELADLQDLLGSIDIKRRLAPAVAKMKGWTPSRTVCVLAVASTDANRTRVADHSNLFVTWRPRWLRGGRLPERIDDEMLLWIPAAASGKRAWLAGRRRVRISPWRRKVDESAEGGPHSETP